MPNVSRDLHSGRPCTGSIAERQPSCEFVSTALFEEKGRGKGDKALFKRKPGKPGGKTRDGARFAKPDFEYAMMLRTNRNASIRKGGGGQRAASHHPA